MIESTPHSISLSLSHTPQPIVQQYNLLLNEMRSLSQSINHNLSRIKHSKVLVTPITKIHGYPFPLSFRNWNSLMQTYRPLMFIFDFMEVMTVSHKHLKIKVHARPPINSLQPSLSLSQPNEVNIVNNVIHSIISK